MTSFVALNVEPESDTEDEIDDSKEIQIEEALKLYQTALKLHSQGPGYFKEAAEAYNSLFASEIFAYPESSLDPLHVDFRANEQIYHINDGSSGFEAPTVPASGGEGAPNTLPQLLYLAYKNYGQFLLDQLKLRPPVTPANDSREGSEPAQNQLYPQGMMEIVSNVLNLLTEALYRDDTDPELWRLVSRICHLLGSKRLARYCLETVLTLSENNPEAITGQLGLVQALAAEQLKPVLTELWDQSSKDSLATLPGTRRAIIKPLKRFVDPCSYLPKHFTKIGTDNGSEVHSISSDNVIEIPVATKSWASCGESIMSRIRSEAGGYINTTPGSRFLLLIPPKDKQSNDISTLQSSTCGNNHSQSGLTKQNERLPDELIELENPGFFHTSSELANGKSLNAQEGNATVQARSTISSDGPGIKEISISEENVIIESREPLSMDRIIDKLPAGKTESSTMDVGGGTVPIQMLSLPARKRSSDEAGLQENTDAGRSRSKRIKAKGSVTDALLLKEATAEDRSQSYQDQIEIHRYTDRKLFETVGSVLSKFQVNSLGAALKVIEIVSGSTMENTACLPIDNTVQDMIKIFSNWDLEKSKAFNSRSGGIDDPTNDVSTSRKYGLTLLFEHSKQSSASVSRNLDILDDDGIEEFTAELYHSWTYLNELGLKWIEALLAPKARRAGDSAIGLSRYELFSWPDSLKLVIVQMLVMLDDFIYAQVSGRIKAAEQRLQKGTIDDQSDEFNDLTRNLTRMIQNIFELHLDIYASITNPSSEVDSSTRVLQLDRLERWCTLAITATRKWPLPSAGEAMFDSLTLRFLWSVVLFISLVDPDPREHTVLCFRNLITILKKVDNPIILMANNAIMPEVSVAAAEREISKLATMDFFSSVFSVEKSHPLAVIESLEPILDNSVQEQREHDNSQINIENIYSNDHGINKKIENDNLVAPPMDQLQQYLNRASVPFKLCLWQKLGDAYNAIKYPPRVVSCGLRSIEVIMEHLESKSFTDSPPFERHASLVGWLRKLEQLTRKTLTIILTEPRSLDFVDEAHLQSSMKALANLQSLSYVQLVWEDSIRFEKARLPRFKSGLERSEFDTAMARLHDMTIRTWLLQFTLLREAAKQNPTVLETPLEDQLMCLRLFHNSLGLRHLCKGSNKIFLRYMRAELSRFNVTDRSCKDMAQIIYDLYGLRLCLNPVDLEDHGCPPIPLDQDTAKQIVDLAMLQIAKISPRDLGKSELKSAIDKLQQVIKIPKPTPATTFNKKTINAFLKSALSPLALYRSLKGIGDLSGAPLKNVSALGDKGWYFLHGYLALSKFRSQSRHNARTTDDLDVASAFLRLDLEMGFEKWETWYRLAQVFDARIEEDVTWSAEKLNSNMRELVLLQRNAIHCYHMATAVATRKADASLETAGKISELYTDFAYRVYASSREPFSMKAFSLQDFTKHFNDPSGGPYLNRPFKELRLYSAWKFACTLLRKASTHKSESWMIFYMLGKFLWKMYNCNEDIRGKAQRISYQEVLNALTRAIELLPEKRDSRHPEKDPTLEPHYKLVSVVHKLVQSRRFKPEIGCECLKATCHARNTPTVEDLEDWEGYIIHVLKSLRSADKANWHHRMVARAAHTIYDDAKNDLRAALGAKHELTQQIFTKTMQTQIWRPDNERPGRHFVYTSRYVSFFIQLATRLNDRLSLELLAKRTRKKPGDFFNHVKLWEEICTAYIKLIRWSGSIPDGNEDLAFKTMAHSTFLLNADRLEVWAQNPDTKSPELDLLRESIELKKLNSNLIKSAPFEDLIGDLYAHLHQVKVPELITKSNTEESRVRMRVDQILMDTSTAATIKPGTRFLDSTSGQPALNEPLATAGVPPPLKLPRPKAVSRREIQRKAEALVIALKPPSIAQPATLKPSPSSTPTASNAKSFVAIAIPGETPALYEDLYQSPYQAPPNHKPTNPDSTVDAELSLGKDDNVPDGDGPADDGGEGEGEGEGEGDCGASSSRSGSVHDSADDESELSEIEELDEGTAAPGPDPGGSGREVRPLFPNLTGLRGGGDVDRGEESAG